MSPREVAMRAQKVSKLRCFIQNFLFCIKKRSLWKKCNVSSGDLLKSDIDTMVKIFFPENNFLPGLNAFQTSPVLFLLHATGYGAEVCS